MEALLEVSDHVATVTLNRPDKLNAWTATMARETGAALQAADAEEQVRVIVLTGAGRGFCAGADLSLLTGIVAGGPDGSLPPASRQRPIPPVRKPLLAAVNGPAVGLGLALSLFCDLRIASEAARFGTAFARRGLIAEFGLAWMLPRLVGLGNAMEMLLTGRLLEPAEARQIGLVNRILPDEGFAEAVASYAAEMAAGVSPRSTRVIKRQVYAGLEQSEHAAFEMAESEMLASLQCEDFKEGVVHFLEKRAPCFTGH